MKRDTRKKLTDSVGLGQNQSTQRFNELDAPDDWHPQTFGRLTNNNDLGVYLKDKPTESELSWEASFVI